MLVINTITYHNKNILGKNFANVLEGLLQKTEGKMKKFIAMLVLCIASTANATEFSCTMSKLSYMYTLEPLVPELFEKLLEEDYDFINATERDLRDLTTEIYDECEDIRTLSELTEVINQLNEGVIGIALDKYK